MLRPYVGRQRRCCGLHHVPQVSRASMLRGALRRAGLVSRILAGFALGLPASRSLRAFRGFACYSSANLWGSCFAKSACSDARRRIPCRTGDDLRERPSRSLRQRPSPGSNHLRFLPLVFLCAVTARGLGRRRGKISPQPPPLLDSGLPRSSTRLAARSSRGGMTTESRASLCDASDNERPW